MPSAEKCVLTYLCYTSITQGSQKCLTPEAVRWADGQECVLQVSELLVHWLLVQSSVH
jgi:hypothetical protein